jgi:hypothetical protein
MPVHPRFARRGPRASSRFSFWDQPLGASGSSAITGRQRVPADLLAPCFSLDDALVALLKFDSETCSARRKVRKVSQRTFPRTEHLGVKLPGLGRLALPDCTESLCLSAQAAFSGLLPILRDLIQSRPREFTADRDRYQCYTSLDAAFVRGAIG